MVADGTSRTLRIFDLAGSLLASAGGEGGGPGEFRALTDAVVVAPDTILVLDAATERVTLFRSDGSFLHSFPLERIGREAGREGWFFGGVTRLVGRAADGTVFVEPFEEFRGTPLGLWEAAWAVLRLDADGENPRLVGRFLREEWYVAGEPGEVAVRRRAFGRRGFVAITGGEVLFTDGSFGGFHRYSLDGIPQGIFRVAGDRTPVSRAEREQWLHDQDLGHLDLTVPRNRARLEAAESMPFPDSHPAVDRMLVDACGYVWLRRAPPIHETRTWDVVRVEDSQWAQSLSLPSHLEPEVIGRHHLATRERSHLDEEFLRVYSLDRRGAPCSVR